VDPDQVVGLDFSVGCGDSWGQRIGNRLWKTLRTKSMKLHAIIAESKNRRLKFAKIHALVASSSLQRSATETPAEIVGKLNNEINGAPSLIPSWTRGLPTWVVRCPCRASERVAVVTASARRRQSPTAAPWSALPSKSAQAMRSAPRAPDR
jgi:hypothetical protein